MATITLPTNAVRKRVETGVVAAGQDLAVIAANGAVGADEIYVCELPLGAYVTRVVVGGLSDLGLTEIGLAGPNVTDDPDFFRASAATGANSSVEADLRLGYKAETEGEVVTFTPTNTPVDGYVYAEYTMDLLVG